MKKYINENKGSIETIIESKEENAYERKGFCLHKMLFSLL